MTIVIVFRNGTEIRMKCDEFKHTTRSNALEKISWDGCIENPLVWVDVNEILCIYRVLSDEKEGEADDQD